MIIGIEELYVKTARKFLDVPYKWGAGHIRDQYPDSGGIDCSGLHRTIVIALGLKGLTYECTTRTLWKALKMEPFPGYGMLAFWEKGPGQICHAEIIVGRDSDGRFYCIGARGSTGRVCFTPLFAPRPAVGLAGFRNPFKEEARAN